MSRIIDTRIVMGDNEVFLCNYEELKDVVDIFLVFECCTPFASGLDREPTFKHFDKRKVYHYPFYVRYKGKTAVEREKEMRGVAVTELLRVMVGADDIFTALDGDEIISQEALIQCVGRLRAVPEMQAIECHLQTSNFFGNWLVPDYAHKWPKVVSGHVLSTMDYHHIRWWPFEDRLTNFPMAGWHFSHCIDSYVKKCLETGADMEKTMNKYRWHLENKITTFGGKPAKIMPKEYLPVSMRTPEMLEIFYRP